MDWLNTPVWRYGGREIRRIDLLLVLAGIVCVAYYAQFGWLSALQGGAMFVLMAMTALWLL